MGEREGLTGELKTLRKGRGVLSDRIGPALRKVSGVLPADSPGTVRSQVSQTLRDAIDTLPTDLRVPMRAAFALDERTQQPFYGDRVEQIAAELRCATRTIRRRVDQGITLVVEHLTRADRGSGNRGSEPANGWYTAELRTLVNLDLPVPEIFETRRVVAEEDGLDLLGLAITVTAQPGGEIPALDIDVFEGGELVRKQRQASDRIGFDLRLAEPLARGEERELTLRFRALEPQRLRPHYVCVPKYRCDRYRLSVRFTRRRPPAQVWRLNGAFQRDLDDPLAVGAPVTANRAGEVNSEFRHLARGLAYGFRWRTKA